MSKSLIEKDSLSESAGAGLNMNFAERAFALRETLNSQFDLAKFFHRVVQLCGLRTGHFITFVVDVARGWLLFVEPWRVV